MRAPQSPCVLCLLLICVVTVGANVIQPQPASVVNVALSQGAKAREFDLSDDTHVSIPQNDTGNVMSANMDTNPTMEEGRGKKKKLLQRLLPLFVMPFLIQSSIVPLFLSMLKFMLVKSLLIGKLALVLIIINAFKNHNSFSGRQDADIANVHYGYHGSGVEEYGSYFN